MNTLYKLDAPEKGRDDLVAVLGTGIQADLHGPKSRTCSGSTSRSRSRAEVNRMGVLAGDNGGFPNGRRLIDDVVDIEEQAVAGFLKGKKVPLGDGVDATTSASSTPSRTCRPRTQGSRTRRRPEA